MKSSAKLSSITPHIYAAKHELSRSFDDLLVARSHVSWNVALDLTAQAVGLPMGQALLLPKASPAPGSMARKLGHESVESFVTLPAARMGLGIDWATFTSEVTASGFMKQFALSHATPDAIINQVEIVSRQLNRQPEDAAEFHRLVAERLSHARAAEQAKRKRDVQKLLNERNVWKQRAQKAETTHTALAGQIETANADSARQAALYQSEIDAINAQLSSLQQSWRGEGDALTAAHNKIAELTNTLDFALGGRGEELFAVQGEISAMTRLLDEARGQATTYKKQHQTLLVRFHNLEKLCEKRGVAIARATDTLKQRKVQVAEEKDKSHFYAMAGVGVALVGFVGWFGLLIML